MKVCNFLSSIVVLFADDGICKCRPISLFLQNIDFISSLKLEPEFKEPFLDR